MYISRKHTIAIVTLTCIAFNSCKNSMPSDIPQKVIQLVSDEINPKLIMDNDSLTIEGDSSSTYSLQISIDNDITYPKSVKAFEKISYMSLLTENKKYFNDIAYILSKNHGDIKIYLSSLICDTTISMHVSINNTKQYKSSVISGVCAPTCCSSEVSNVEADVIKWLYRKQKTNLGDTIIHDMCLYYKELSRTPYKEYVTTTTIPVVSSMKGLYYKISSDLVADHYYLVATSYEGDLERFVEDMVSQKFKSSANSLKQRMPCHNIENNVSRIIFGGGVKCIFLVGINNDWSHQIVPVGVICVDELKPVIGIGNRGVAKQNPLDTRPFPSPKTSHDNRQMTYKNNKIRVFIDEKIDVPNISGSVEIKYGHFSGNSWFPIPFTFIFEGDVKTIVVHQAKAQNAVEVIDLADKNSPYHTTIGVMLNTGENYIPIDAIDGRGNKSTYDLKMTIIENDN